MRILSFIVVGLALAGTGAAVAESSAGRSGPTATEAARGRPILTVRSSRYGRILFDGRGRALYAFTRDPRRGRSRCYGACATAWPVLFAKGSLRAGAGVRQALIGTTRRRNGRRQVTYNGWPLYYYVSDRRPGQVTCQNVDQFGGLWLVVRPDGRLVR
jgi:predicted lipoprotein with Yx(FWY)xxD motif